MMEKLKELKTTHDIVKHILSENPHARNSDSFLIVKVYSYIMPEVVTMPFYTVMASQKEFGLPSPETIRRTRQKLQAEFPELSANDKVAAGRMENEESFREYALGKYDI